MEAVVVVNFGWTGLVKQIFSIVYGSFPYFDKYYAVLVLISRISALLVAH